MGTSAPAIRTIDIPIVEPYRPPKQLPAPNPDTFAPDFSPAKQPEREPVPVSPRRHTKHKESLNV